MLMIMKFKELTIDNKLLLLSEQFDVPLEKL
jgi:hypothetical protein